MARPKDLNKAPIIIDDMGDENRMDIIKKPGINYDIMELLKYTLENDKCLHQFKWKQKVELMQEPQIRSILDMLSIKSKSKFDEDMNSAVIKTLTLNWEGIKTFDNNMKEPLLKLHNDLFSHLEKNVNKLKKIALSKMIYNYRKDVDECLVVECPLKVLKTLFNSRFGVDDDSDIYEFDFFDSNKGEFNISVQNFTNWPHMGVKFSLNGFEMVHQNNNHIEFNVINIENKLYKPKVGAGMDTSLFYAPNNCKEYHKSQDINLRLFNLRTRIMKKNCEISSGKKVELITFLNEMTYDIRSATEDVGIGVTYYANLCPFPYARYMANTNHNHQQRGRICKTDITIRLQQVTYPAIKFCIAKFNKTFDNDPLDNRELMTSLCYFCNLCETAFETHIFAEMTNHVINVHGNETGYVCVRCDRSFPVKVLSGNRWTHACTPRI